MFVDIFFFFKQKTAYEMRISDWSSDVCSSDLILLEARKMAAHFERDDGKGEKESDPDASPHIAIFFAGAVRCGRHDRLKYHATDGAASGTGLLTVGTPRAGPDGALASRRASYREHECQTGHSCGHTGSCKSKENK